MRVEAGCHCRKKREAPGRETLTLEGFPSRRFGANALDRPTGVKKARDCGHTSCPRGRVPRVERRREPLLPPPHDAWPGTGMAPASWRTLSSTSASTLLLTPDIRSRKEGTGFPNQRPQKQVPARQLASSSGASFEQESELCEGLCRLQRT